MLWNLGIASSDLGSGTWHLGPGTWYLGPETWELGHGTWLNTLLLEPHMGRMSHNQDNVSEAKS